MYQINLINKLLSEYKLWTLKIKSARVKIENNILQNDDSDLVEQKIASIVFAGIFMWIVTSFIGFLGGSTGGFFAGLIFFAIGWILSKLINKMIFGTPRKMEDLHSNEIRLLDDLKRIEKKHVAIRDEINKKTILVNFTNYGSLKKEFEAMMGELHNFNTIHLSLKYKLKHKYVVSRYKVEVDKFHKIYANK